MQGRVSASVARIQLDYPTPPPEYRNPVSQQAVPMYQITLASAPPAEAQVLWHFYCQVPRDCGEEDEIVLRHHQRDNELRVAMKEIHPEMSDMAAFRVAIHVQSILRGAFSELARLGAERYKARGY